MGLTVRQCNAATEPGLHGDGNGLYLRVWAGGSKSWILRTVIQRKRTDVGLGGFPLVTLAEARNAAIDTRRIARAGGNPLAGKQETKAPTFREAAQRTHDNLQVGWRSRETSRKWNQILEKRAYPSIGNKRVDAIGRENILRILEPIWQSTPRVTSDLRTYLKQTFEWCQGNGYVQANPADGLKGVLRAVPTGNKHYRALPYSEVPAALRSIEGSSSGLVAKLGLRFMILTAARGGEVRGGRWSEIDIETREWRLPPERMKTAKAFVVPLSDAALTVLDQARTVGDGSDMLFPSPVKRGRPLSNKSFDSVLDSVGLHSRTTPHGFRQAFRTWAEERTNADYATKEMALAHAVGSAVERSYARSDLLDKRRRLMNQWAAYLTGAERAKVTRIG